MVSFTKPIMSLAGQLLRFFSFSRVLHKYMQINVYVQKGAWDALYFSWSDSIKSCIYISGLTLMISSRRSWFHQSSGSFTYPFTSKDKKLSHLTLSPMFLPLYITLYPVPSLNQINLCRPLITDQEVPFFLIKVDLKIRSHLFLF